MLKTAIIFNYFVEKLHASQNINFYQINVEIKKIHAQNRNNIQLYCRKMTPESEYQFVSNKCGN